MSDKRILIIEDNPVNMELATDLLDAAGYETVGADNAEEGIRLVRHHLPDLVLMDIALPGMDGLTATGILKGDAATSHIPIIALTAHAMKGDEEKALGVGCIGYITKPINTRSFSKLIAEFLDMAATTGAAAVPAPAPTAAPIPTIVVTPPATTTTIPAVTPPAAMPIPMPPAPAPAPPVQKSAWGSVIVPITTNAETTDAPIPMAPIPMEPVVVPPVSAVVSQPIPMEAIPMAPVTMEAIPMSPVPMEPIALELTPSAESVPVTAKPVVPSTPAIPMAPIIMDVPSPTAERPAFIAPAAPSAPSAPSMPIPMPPTPEVPAARPNPPLNNDRPALSVVSGGRRKSRRDNFQIVTESSTAKLLVVDDDELNREMISAQLRTLGYEPVVVNDGFEALATVDDTFDLILLDVMMPGMDGCETCRRIREEKGLRDLPVIMVTALSSREDQLRAVESGANDWITKPVDRNELRVRTDSQLKMKAAQDALKKHQRDLEATVRARTADLRRALEQVTAEKDRTKDAYLDTLQRLALTAEFRDGFMAASHIRCIGNYCAVLARGMDLPEDTAETLLHASPIHDIGLLGVPEEVLHKGEARNHEEETTYRDHTVLGARLLSGSRSELLRAAEVIALSHHEKWDGSGFPHGRAGEAIPLFGRICAVADTFDTITAYNGGDWRASNEEAKEVIVAGRGTDFDPQVVDAFLANWDEIMAVQKRFRRTEAPPEDLVMPRKLAA